MGRRAFGDGEANLILVFFLRGSFSTLYLPPKYFSSFIPFT